MNYFAIDIGSSFVKGAVLDPQSGQLAAIRRRPFPGPLTATFPGQFEVDLPAIVTAVREVLWELSATDQRACRAVLFCSQMGGVVLVDAKGRPLSQYLSWRDQRTVASDVRGGRTCLDELRARLDAGLLRSLGNEVQAGSATSLLFWLSSRDQLPARAVPLTLGDYVLGQLCQSAPSTEYTQALGTLNLDQQEWHRELFCRLGLDRLAWPRLVAVNEPIGEVRLGDRDVPCHPVVGDQQAALYGAELEIGELSINVSTGSQVSVVTSHFEPGEYQSRPFLDGRFLNTITHLPAGRSLDVLLNLVTEIGQAADGRAVDAWSYVSSAVERAGSAEGLEVNLAFFAGPMGDRGHIREITTENLTVGRLFHGAFASMAANYERCASRLFPRRDWERVVFSGGLVQKLGCLRELIQQRLPGPARICESTEDTLQGLLRLAMRLESVAD